MYTTALLLYFDEYLIIKMKISEFLKSFDRFGSSISFNFRGRQNIGAWSGIVLTLIVYILVSCYAYVRFRTMWTYEDTLTQETVILPQDI